MVHAILIFILVLSVLLAALMVLKRRKPPPPPPNLKRGYDDWEKEDEKRGWKDPES